MVQKGLTGGLGPCSSLQTVVCFISDLLIQPSPLYHCVRSGRLRTTIWTPLHFLLVSSVIPN